MQRALKTVDGAASVALDAPVQRRKNMGCPLSLWRKAGGLKYKCYIAEHWRRRWRQKTSPAHRVIAQRKRQAGAKGLNGSDKVLRWCCDILAKKGHVACEE